MKGIASLKLFDFSIELEPTRGGGEEYIEHFQLYTQCIHLDIIWYPDVKSENKTVSLMNTFFYTFQINLYHIYLEHTFSPTFCIPVTNEASLDQFFGYLSKIENQNDSVDDIFLYLVNIFRTQILFSNF